jgi:hypothetical protein
MFHGFAIRRRRLSSRLKRSSNKRGQQFHSRCFAHESLEPRMMFAGTWTPLANPFSGGGSMELLSDGTVVKPGNYTDTSYKLTPDADGSYINGTSSPIADRSVRHLYQTSTVLTDGRLMNLGGKAQSFSMITNTNTGEIYDPLTNTWTAMANFPEPYFGDSSAKLLSDGRLLAGYKFGPQTHIYDPATDTWSPGPTKLDNDPSVFQPWVRLHDGSILAINYSGEPRAQRFDPTTNTWIDSGSIPVSLRQDFADMRTGPAVVLPDGRVFHVGGNSNTALYTPSDTPGGTGTWVAGPVIPDGLTSWTAAAATMPNGRVLFVAGDATSNGPIHVFEFDPTAPIESSLSDVTPTGLSEGPAFASRMVVLPTGQVLVVLPAPTGIHHIYTPDGAPDASWKPTITSIVASGSNLYTLTGTQLTGVTSGANNRDNGAGETSRPIVQLTNAAGKVYYARTFDWSTNAIATGSTPVTTEFALPEWVPADTYSLTVIANGIASDPVPFAVAGTKFYVVDDAVSNITYRYAPDGATRGSSFLTAGNTAPRGVASTVAGAKTWVIDANRKVYIYSASGALLGSWTAGSLANNATPEGIATNGTDIWIVDGKSDKVFRYTGAASRLAGSQNAASSFALNKTNGSPKDVVTDGTSLWVVNDSTMDKVFKYTLSGTLLGSWTIDSANAKPTGITINPASVSDIWIVDSGTDRVYQYNGAVTRTSGSQAAATSFALAAGNTNPQGIADPPSQIGLPLLEAINVHPLPIATDGRRAANHRVDSNSFSSLGSTDKRLGKYSTDGVWDSGKEVEVFLAREEVFASFATEADQPPRKCAFSIATIREHDLSNFADCVVERAATLAAALDPALAIVL